MSYCSGRAGQLLDTGRLVLDQLPCEIWQKVFSYVENDDATLFSLLEVSDNFRAFLRPKVLQRVDSDSYWRDALLQRGVCIGTLGEISSDGVSVTWFARYRQYVNSMACFRCFWNLSKTASGQPTTTPVFYDRCIIEARNLLVGETIIPAALGDADIQRRRDMCIRVLSTQFCDLDKTKTPDDQTNVSSLIVTVLGPPNTPYDEGRFQLLISFPENYPMAPPQARMLTKIVSPYFTDHGDFYYKFSKTHVFHGYPPWPIEYDIGYIVDIVGHYLHLSVPNDAETPSQSIVVDRELNELFTSNRADFDQFARKCTSDCAMMQWNISAEDFQVGQQVRPS